MIIQGVFGNETAEMVLLYLQNYGSGHPRGIAQTFGLAVSQVQRQLERLEQEGILVSRLVGRTREYVWNPRCFYRKELRDLLERALKNLPSQLIEKFFRERRRPRKPGKALL